MKILVATIVDNINFGTYLQAYATSLLLKRRGAEVDILNYIRPYLDVSYYAKKMLADKSRPLPVRLIRSLSYLVLGKMEMANVKRFLKGKASLTKEIQSLDELHEIAKDGYDLFLTGSDQVWNSQHNLGIDPIFYFEGIDGKKVSLAASVGMDSFGKEEKDRIKCLLQDYDHISVRESYGKEAISKLGLEGVEIDQILDPTLLINKEEWAKVPKSNFKKTEDYLLVYSVEIGKDEMVLKLAREIAEKKNLKVYLVSATPKNKKYKNLADRSFTFTDVDTFLSLMAQADYVVCSSFHGTAFAINFNKDFVTVAPERFNTRVNSILKLLNLQDRYIESKDDVPTSSIDYSKVNPILEAERKKSAEVIDKLLC